MERLRIMRVARTLTVSLLVAVALSACRGGVDTEAPSAAIEVDVPSRAMSNERKTSELAPGFPFQVPVYDGVIVATQEVTPGTLWGYDIAAPEPAETVAEWYRRAYAGANWVLEREEPVEADTWSGVALYFAKGVGAQSVITVRTEADDRTTVSATVGLGAGIGDTF